MTKLFNKMRRNFDLILFDLSPALNSLNYTILGLSNYIISPTINDLFSRIGFRLLKMKFISHNNFLNEPKSLGYKMNRVETTKGEMTEKEEIHKNMMTKYLKKIDVDSPFLGFLENFGTLNIRLQGKRMTIYDYLLEETKEIYLNSTGSNKFCKSEILYGQMRNITINICDKLKEIMDDEYDENEKQCLK
jgi:cellulose biosynthesis protein BcsQ